MVDETISEVVKRIDPNRVVINGDEIEAIVTLIKTTMIDAAMTARVDMVVDPAEAIKSATVLAYLATIAAKLEVMANHRTAVTVVPF